MAWIEKTTPAFWTANGTTTWATSPTRGTPPTAPYWALSGGTGARLDAGSWKTGYRPTKARVTALRPSISFVPTLTLRDSSGATLLTFVGFGSLTNWTAVEGNVSFGSFDIGDLYTPTPGGIYVSKIEFFDAAADEFWTAFVDSHSEACP